MFISNTLLAILSGEWRIERTISDMGYFIGTGCFEPLGDNKVLLSEQGKTFLETGDSLESSARYLYVFDQNNSLTIKRYAPSSNEALDLHNLCFQTDDDSHHGLLRGCHTHQCLDDFYHLDFHITSPDRIETTYRITGPKKNYAIHTVMLRDAIIG